MNPKHITFKISILFLFMLTAVSIGKAQNTTGKITGRVTTANSQALAFATVSIKGLKKSTSTNNDGVYVFQHVKAGIYRLKVSFIGMQSAERQVDVVAGKATEVDFVLNSTSAALAEVRVTKAKAASLLTAGKSGIGGFDLPQSTGVVSNQVLTDQQVDHLGDAIRNVSGVSLTQTRGGVGETFSARGYSIGIGGGAGSVLQNGALVNTAGFPQAEALESVEVLKGSAALLYGNVSGGLLINMVTKKPQFTNGGELSMRYGSNNEYKPMLDIYGPLNQNLAYRAVVLYENDGSYRDHVKTRNVYINPSLLYKIGTKTTLLLEGDFLQSNLTPDWGVGSLNNGQAIPTMVPRSQYINTAWAYNHINQYTGQLTLNHNFSDSWKLNAIASVQNTGVDSYGSSLPSTVNAVGDWNRYLARAHTTEDDYTAQANLNGKFKTAGIAHQLLLGTDATEVLNLSNAYNIGNTPIASYLYDVINIIDLNKYTQRTDIPNATAIAQTHAPVYRIGAYLQDMLNLNDKFKVLAGVRWSWQQTNQTRIDSLLTGKSSAGAAVTRYDRAFSPKAALIYQPIKSTSMYVAYSNSFVVNSGTNVNTGQGLKPSILNQYEAGLKNELFDGKVSANLAVYQIINNDVAVVAPYLADGITPNTDNTIKTYGGQTTSDGIEADVTGKLSSNFYFIVGYAYNNARYTQTSGLKGAYIVGERLVINPKNTANASVFYTFSKWGLKGLKLGASVFYTGDRLAGYNNTIGQTQNYSRLLPVGGFVTANVSLGYTYKKLSLLGQLSNITNTMNYLIHDNYSVTPIAPRQFLTTLSYKF